MKTVFSAIVSIVLVALALLILIAALGASLDKSKTSAYILLGVGIFLGILGWGFWPNKRKRKNREAEIATTQISANPTSNHTVSKSQKAPSKKQIGYLKGLGYLGATPETSREASFLIDQLKSGKSSSVAQKSLAKERKKMARRDNAKLKERLASQIEYLNWIEEELRGADGIGCAGFRLSAIPDDTTTEEMIYANAFLPFDVAKRYPELLLMNLDDDELEKSPRKGKVIMQPGVVIDMEEYRQKN